LFHSLLAYLQKKQNFAACGTKRHYRHFLSSRPTELQPQKIAFFIKYLFYKIKIKNLFLALERKILYTMAYGKKH